MISNILVAIEEDVERSTGTVNHAVDIAKGVGARVTLLHVYDEERFREQLDQFSLASADPTELVKRNKTMREAASILESQNVPYDLEGAVGSPVDEISRYVAENGVDHVFLGGRRQSPTGKAVLGSVSQRVLLSVDPPCTIVMSD